MTLLAAQLYTLRELCKTPAEVATACAKVKKMGYDGVQISGICQMDPKEMRRILDGEGLACPATHISLQRIENEVDAVIEEHKTIGCDHVAIGGFFPPEPWTKALWMDFIDRYNALCEKYAAAGITIGYHNHSHEFAPVEGRRPIDMLINLLDPRIWMEIDTYWVAHGGADPAAYVDKVAGRISRIHLKDMTMTPARVPKMCEIGDGNLNWPRILQSCRNSGVKWYIVERDSGDMEPFASLERSIFNMKEKLGLF